MATTHSKYIIIGAGLSGLTTAYQLLNEGEDNFIILEGNDKIGGRINTLNGIDLGAAWLQTHHQHIAQLIDVLGLQKFEQYNTGKGVLIYDSNKPAHYFESDTTGPSAYRIADGSFALINELYKPLSDKINLNTRVTAISENKDTIAILTDTQTYTANTLIVTLPPKLASTLKYEPKLPNLLLEAMHSTHTWMSNAIKIGLTFKTPFWREKGLSGTLISQISPVTELYDHCDYNHKIFSLMGFVNEKLRNESPENRKEQTLNYLEKHLGSAIRNYINYHEKDWSKDIYTTGVDTASAYIGGRYGNPLFQDFYMNGKLLFSGTETSPFCGGYMEGAVYSGIKTANRLLNK